MSGYCYQLAAYLKASERVWLLATAAWQGRLKGLRCHKDHKPEWMNNVQQREEEAEAEEEEGPSFDRLHIQTLTNCFINI